MYLEKRPTCVTVIGWAWIIIGGFMCLSAILGLFGSLMLGQMSKAEPAPDKAMSALLRFFPFMAIVQIIVAVFSIIAAISFLRLKSWSRNALEALTWLLLLFVVGFMVFWEVSWMTSTSSNAPTGFSMIGAVMGVVISAIYVIPLGIMLKFLRGEKVRTAVKGIAQESNSPCSPPAPQSPQS